MRNLVIAAATLALASLVSPLLTPASAVEYPYCATGSWGSGGCSYATLDQCRAFASGAGGYCVSNPRYTSGANTTAGSPRPRARR